jgi:hypothetical protein
MASPFSGKAGRNAAIWSSMQADWQRGENRGFEQAGYEKAGDALTTGYEQSLAPLNDFYESGRGDLKSGLADANKLIGTGLDKSLGNINQNYGQALSNVNKFYGQGAETLQGAAAGWDPLINRAMTGVGMYDKSMGLGGQAGRDEALAAFQTGPGYQWNVDQATSQAARAANRLGMTYSGNTVDAQTRLAQNLANQEWGNWQKNLQGYVGAAENATQGKTGVLNNLATLQMNQGNRTSDINMAQGNKLAELNTGAYNQMGQNAFNTGGALAQSAFTHGTDLANLNTNYGQSMAGLELGHAQNQTGMNDQYWGTVIPAGQAGMMAGQNAAANKWGAIMGGVQMGAQMLGGGMGGGGFNLGSFFGGKK